MDPGTIVGVASSAIAFVSFAIELVKGAHEIYNSLNGSSDANAHVDLVISDLQTASRTLIVQNTTRETGKTSQHEEALAELSTKCYKKCIELLNITQKLKINDRTKWSSFKAAWKLHWKKDDIDHMHGQLRDYRLAILLRLNQMQIENAIQADAKLDTILREFRRPMRDEHEVEASICARIKHQLYFESMHRREDNISDAGEGTCSWITDASMDYSEKYISQFPWWFALGEREARSHARSEYISWLGSGVPTASQATQPTGDVPPSPSILHISGKAGSGKSTLMRHLFRHEKTRTALETWAGTRTLVIASFYFWVASGDDMQKSLNGLYRTILHDVLDQCPELAVYLFPSQWLEMQRRIVRNEEAKDSADAVLFRDRAISDAFLKLVGPATSNSPLYCFCFFIDGLDEYRDRAAHGGGDSKDFSPGFKKLSKELLRWSTSAHVKICTTSRPYSEFLDPLHRISATVLHLEKVNQCDIYRHCKNTFDDDDDIRDMQISYNDLLLKITKRAEGVFLWTVLTVRAMIKSLCRGDSREMQMQKLDAVPAELDSLYTMLLSQIDESDRERSNQLFLLALALSSDLSGHLGSGYISCLDDLTDPNFPDDIPLVLTEAHEQQREIQGRRLLNSLTHGMVVNHRLHKMTFSHRTAYDYMKKRRDRGELTSTILDFDQIDVWGRALVGNMSKMSDLRDAILAAFTRSSHQKRDDTYSRLSKRIKRISKTNFEKENPNAATNSVLPIMGEFTVGDLACFDTPVASNMTVPRANISIISFAAIYAIYNDVHFGHRVKRWLTCVPHHLLRREDINILALIGIISTQIEFGKAIFLPSDTHEDDFLQWLEGFDFDFNIVYLDTLPYPYWMYIATAMINMALHVCIFGLNKRISPPKKVIKMKALPPDAAKCKVALNDRRGTVITLQQLLEVKAVNWKDAGCRVMYNPSNRGEDLLEEIVKYILGEPLSWVRNVSDDGQDDKQDDEWDLDLSKQRIYIKYIEYEGLRLDADFTIDLACPDLMK